MAELHTVFPQYTDISSVVLTSLQPAPTAYFLQSVCFKRSLPVAGPPAPSAVTRHDEIAPQGCPPEYRQLHAVVSPIRATQPANSAAFIASIGLGYVRVALEQTVLASAYLPRLFPGHESMPGKGTTECLRAGVPSYPEKKDVRGKQY